MSKSRIAEYMALLARSERARKAHREDADKAMREFGLTDEQRAVIATKDPEAIKEAVRKEDPDAVQTLAIVFG
jgi:hypothetical protein